MPKLSNMVGETGQIEIAVANDEPLVVEYRRGKMTPRRQIKMLTLQRELTTADRAGQEAAAPEVLRGLCEMVSDLIVSWNLTDDAGAPLATDVDSISDVELSVITAIVDEIGRQARPDPLSSGGSSNGSSPMASSEPRLSTTAS